MINARESRETYTASCENEIFVLAISGQLMTNIAHTIRLGKAEAFPTECDIACRNALSK